MNRIIKFRAKTKGDEWVYGYYVYTYPNEHRIFGKDRTSIEVIPETVGQYTGLMDKDGNEIYEGDIIRIKGNTVEKDFGIVTFHKNGYFYVDDSYGEFPRDCVKPIGDFFNSISRDDFFKGMQFYVNGNIHDNKIK